MHNEQEALASLFPALDSLAEEMLPHRATEFILVDDGSMDATFKLAHAWADRCHHPARILRLNPREGLGGALRCGFGFAVGRIVITYDADRPYPLEDAVKLANAIDDGADIATASPYHPEGRVEGVGPGRLLPSKLANLAYRIRLGRQSGGLATYTCGFRAYRREILESILPSSQGFLATAQMMTRGLRQNLKVAEIPSVLRPRQTGTSKMNMLRTTCSHLAHLVRCR